jgi:hypothetical protein
MPGECEEFEDEVAAGAICPMPECGTLAIAFRAAYLASLGHIQPWEFACGRCDAKFSVPEDELVFQSVPKAWLLAGVHLA